MPAKYPPGPRGGLLGLNLLREIQHDLLGFSVRMAREHGDAVHWRLGPMHFFQFTHPEMAQQVLVHHAKQLRKPTRLKQILGKWDGQGLVLSEGELWARQRRLIQPAFQPKRIESYVPDVVRLTRQKLDGWARLTEINSAEAITSLTLDVVLRVLFGAELDEPAERIAAATQAMQRITMREMSRLIIWPTWLVPWSRQEREAIDYLIQLIEKLIAGRRLSGQRGQDLMSLLLEATDSEQSADARRPSMNDQQVRDEVMTLFLAGHETTATSLEWTLYLLARNPQVQAELAELVRGVAGERPLVAADLQQLAAVEHAIQESMRLYPAVYFTSREAPATFELTGYHIPKYSQLHLVPLVMHRDPRWFPEPEVFRPERFAGEPTWPPGAYIPFGAGPRACIGRGLAMLEMTLITATILQRYRLCLAPGQGEPELEAQISLHPKGGVRLMLEPVPQAAATNAGR